MSSLTPTSVRTLVIIPARGGSKGIPRKNLRPLNGRPLIYYAVTAAREAGSVDRVLVSTDDEEIALLAERFGATVQMRPSALSGDDTTLDQVVEHVVRSLESRGEHFDLILTVQPTAPLIRPEDIDAAVARFADEPRLDSLISVCEDRHLRWKRGGEGFVPDYVERVNRQQLPETYRETGALIACRRANLERGSRIGGTIGLYLTPPERSTDIDTVMDFWLCGSLLRRRRIVFAVVGNAAVGMGHAYRAVLLANELVNHELIFVCGEDDGLAVAHIKRHNYRVECVPVGRRLEAMLALQPDLVINDILDTDADYVVGLQRSGAKVVCFEDMGLGASVADLVVNALYPPRLPADHVLSGPEYFCLREEFLYARGRGASGEVTRILITFGGADEGDLSRRLIAVAGVWLVSRGITIDLVTGLGYARGEELERAAREISADRIHVRCATPRISDYMASADLAITSGGRTVLELASLGVPTMVICQNRRETTHSHLSSEQGVVNLGLRTEVSDEAILATVQRLVTDAALRETMCRRARASDLRGGKRRVIACIEALLDPAH